MRRRPRARWRACCSPSALGKAAALSVNASSDLPRVAADPRRLRRVLLKLVGNAVKFTERGGVRITAVAPMSQHEWRLRALHHRRYRPGRSLGNRARAVRCFRRADDSYARQHNGAGVGLAVAKRIVDGMGGAIGVENKPGLGATFWFTVPVSLTAALSANEPEFRQCTADEIVL